MRATKRMKDYAKKHGCAILHLRLDTENVPNIKLGVTEMLHVITEKQAREVQELLNRWYDERAFPAAPIGPDDMPDADVVHYIRRDVYSGCDEIAGSSLGALYATDDPSVARAEAGFLFTTEAGRETCPRCRERVA